MQITKGIKALIPTVQYGNVTFEASITHEFEVRSNNAQEIAKQVRSYGLLIDTLLKKEYDEQHRVFSEDPDNLTSM